MNGIDMGTISFLWRHRERPSSLRRWLKVWIKRFMLALPLIRLLIRPIWFRMKGASIGRMSCLGVATISGDATNLCIGRESSLGRCEISLHDRVTVGDRVTINDGARILSASHSLNDPLWRHKRRPVVIGDYAWIATGAIVLPGVRIGNGAVVGAGAVLRVDLPDYSIAIGNPAIVQSFRRTTDLRYSPVFMNAPFEAWLGPTPCGSVLPP